MNWSDLQPGVRLAILGVGFVLVALLLWVFVVSPLRASEASTRTQLVSAESQLEQLERQIEAIPPATDAERRAWQASADALRGQLGPESELPLFIEAVVRLSESQGLEAYVAAADSSAAGGRGADSPTQAERVLGEIPGVWRIPLTVTAFGQYDDMGRFVAQLGRLGWVTEIAGVQMQRQFPEVVADIRVLVYFRAAGSADGNAPQQSGPQFGQPMGAQGGGQ